MNRTHDHAIDRAARDFIDKYGPAAMRTAQIRSAGFDTCNQHTSALFFDQVACRIATLQHIDAEAHDWCCCGDDCYGMCGEAQ